MDECPQMYNSDSHHGATLKSEEDGEQLFIPMEMEGTISYINTRLPTQDELSHSKYYIATSSTKEWDPHSDDFRIAEEAVNWAKPRSILRNISSITKMNLPSMRNNTARKASRAIPIRIIRMNGVTNGKLDSRMMGRTLGKIYII